MISFKEFVSEKGPGLWANIHKRRKSGKRMRKKGEKGAPTAAAMKSASEASDFKLTPAREKELEKLAKDLPDADFKKKYGKDWKSVKIATAMNMLKKKHGFKEGKTDMTAISSWKKKLKDVKGLTKQQVQMLSTLPTPVITSLINQVGMIVADMSEGKGSKPEPFEDGYKRRVVPTTNPEHKEQGYNWRIKGKKKDNLTIKLYKTKPSFDEFVKQMRRVAGHEFG